MCMAWCAEVRVFPVRPTKSASVRPSVRLESSCLLVIITLDS